MARPNREDNPERLTMRIPVALKKPLKEGLAKREVTVSEWGKRAAERTLEEWEEEDENRNR
jgi:hypothetical protein